MPIYEYRCNECKKEFSFLFLSQKEAEKAECKYCKGRNLTRLLSSFRLHQTEADRLAGFDPTKKQGDEFYKDSRNVGLWAKKKMKDMGVDLGGKMDEIVEKGRTGKILDD
jgi:putative FmdB family regulatory protein